MSDLDLLAEIDALQADSSLDPTERIAHLRKMSETVREPVLLGKIETYIGSLQLQVDAAEMEQAVNMLAMSEDANVRDALIESGKATPEEMDRAGLLSHAELDRREAGGTLDEDAGEEKR